MCLGLSNFGRSCEPDINLNIHLKNKAQTQWTCHKCTQRTWPNPVLSALSKSLASLPPVPMLSLRGDLGPQETIPPYGKMYTVPTHTIPAF